MQFSKKKKIISRVRKEKLELEYFTFFFFLSSLTRGKLLTQVPEARSNFKHYLYN